MHPSTDNLATFMEQYMDTQASPALGVVNVLDTLQEICGAKAEHLRVNWQDERAATEWERYARRIDSARACVERDVR